mgnify:CR=1 FL=1
MFAHKEFGETTKEFSDRIRLTRDLGTDTKIAICGKLDPQARGITSILIGKDTQYMDKYLQSDKTYEFSIVLGISTGSDDIMGKITESKELNMDCAVDAIRTFMHTYISNQTVQKYHPISAKKIRLHPGKKQPLWYWTKLGLLSDDDLPSKSVIVYSLEEIGAPITTDFIDYLSVVTDRLSLITNKKAFDIDHIVNSWTESTVKTLVMLQYRIKVSSGFYVRMIAKNIRDVLNIPVHIFGINRINVQPTAPPHGEAFRLK